jgi:hypothetical protein
MDARVGLPDLLSMFTGDDGTLPDCTVEGSVTADWPALFALVRAKGWRVVWCADHGDVPLPADPAEVLRQVNTVAVWPAPGLRVNFFPGPGINFDFDRRELRDQATADALCELISAIGQQLGKAVQACHEGSADVFLSYDPRHHAFRLAASPSSSDARLH